MNIKLKINIFVFVLISIFPTISLGENEVGCTNITVKENEFKGEKNLYTPIINSQGRSQASILKNVSKRNKTVFYLHLTTIGRTVVVDGKGAYIIFDDKTKFYKDVKIDVKANEEGFKYSAFIELTTEEFELFKHKKIDKYMLYIFEDSLYDEDAESLRNNAKCIENM
jgi:hypothetical protein